jgi:hypothetical protein
MSEEEWHTCHFCGTQLNEKGYEVNGDRHFVSDCRPDLIEHEIGDTCTWASRRKPLTMADGTIESAWPEEDCCYAYQDRDRNWTKEHKHFYPDGPM